MVYRAAYRVAGNAADAEDVLQTVFLRLARNEAQTEQVRNPEGYLRRAAVNCALDLLRSRQRIELVDPDSAPPVEDDPERQAQAAELRDWLRRSVSALSPLAAEAFALRFFEGRDNGEIAAMLGTSEASIAVTLHRARERLFREYRQYMGDES